MATSHDDLISYSILLGFNSLIKLCLRQCHCFKTLIQGFKSVINVTRTDPQKLEIAVRYAVQLHIRNLTQKY